MKRGWGLVFSLMLCFALPRCVAAANQPADPQETTDWPSVISQLRQQVYERSDDSKARQQLAIAYNNYGVTLGNQGRWEPAIEQLKEALRLDEANDQFRQNMSRIYVNQAQELYGQHRVKEAKTGVEQAIRLNPKLAQAYVLLGQLEYESQRLKEAKAAWQRALELDPSRQDELGKSLERVTQELPVESKFEKLSQAYFDLRYQDQLERPVGSDLRDALLEARRDVGADFAYWPTHKIVVLIYSAEQFRALRQETPDWVGGQFDGKIRVPIPGGQFNLTSVRETLFHEYTHALMQDLTEGKCPTWLNEGLAVYEGNKQQRYQLQQLVQASQANRLVPLGALSDQFSFSMPVDQVRLGYEQSYSIVSFLVQRYGFWRIRRLLKAIDAGQPWDTALAGEFHMKLAKLEANWREWLPESLK